MEKQVNPQFALSILIVLYNIEIYHSETVKSLLSCQVKYRNSKLVLWNNGPVSLKEKNMDSLKKLGFDIEIIETIHNMSLAFIYNHFIDSFDSERFVILDHDTILNKCFLNAIVNADSEKLSMPIIKMNGIVRAPYIDKKLGAPKQNISSNNRVVSIGSGLIIGKNIVNKLKSNFGSVFDERFYLYGVDSTFFHRVNHLKLGGSIKILATLEHSLSRHEVEHKDLKKFRLKERSYDYALQLRYYYPLYKSFYLIIGALFKNVYLKALNRNQYISPIEFIRAIFVGKHYRSP